MADNGQTPKAEALEEQEIEQLSSTNSSGKVKMMNSSIDEFLAEYYGPTYRAEHYGNGAKTASESPSPEMQIGNFDIGGDDLMTSITEEGEPSLETLEALPVPMAMLQLNAPADLSSKDKQIVNIRTRRKSISYDIIFNETHAVQIKIKESSSSQQSNENCAKVKEEIKRVEVLEKDLELSKQKNAELEHEIEDLKQKLQTANEIIQRLELELAQVYTYQ